MGVQPFGEAPHRGAGRGAGTLAGREPVAAHGGSFVRRTAAFAFGAARRIHGSARCYDEVAFLPPRRPARAPR